MTAHPTKALDGLRLHDLIEAQAERTPEAVAVSFGSDRVTYRDLEARANRLARRLAAEGAGPETLVAVCVDRSVGMVVALLAILKAGAAYVPLDPSYPKERLAYMLEDSGAPALLTEQRLAGLLPGGAARVIHLDAARGELDRESPERFDGGAVSSNLAYVIYTSGSTGRPKGAMNTHRGICNRLLWMQDTYGLSSEDRVLQKTPFSFDVSVWEFFWPLIAGARIVLAKPGGHQDAAYLVDIIDREKVTVVHFVPSMLQVFLEEPDLDRCGSLRQVVCSGEALSPELCERFFSRMAAGLDNLYGPTEAAVDVTSWRCERGARKLVPIGRPIANTRIHLLDRGLAPVPEGGEGELFIGGVPVGRGYWERPDLTAERFVPDPFSAKPGARLYRTGDLARTLPDGNIEFLGRMDDQVKIRGHRIELQEIVSALRRHPAVADAVVASREDTPGLRQLAAYIVPNKGGLPSVTDLRAFLAETLPDYMLPVAYVALDVLPLTPSGKLDRRALPAPDSRRPDLASAFQAPRTELERFLAKLWAEILGLDSVGVDDKFFELGGDSVRGAALINRVQRELGEHIYIVALFEAPSVADFARLLEANYAGALERRFGLARRSAPAGPGPGPDRIGQAELDAMRRIIPSLPPAEAGGRGDGPRNPRALFILAPPRSGTTLLRVMLAGHPGLFAAAELQLLGFQTLAERKAAFTGKFSLWLEGTIRANMEIFRCDAQRGKEIMEEHERRGLTTKEFYRVLQDSLRGRTLVDKSPSYAMDPATLAKAERDFEGALYVHLVRHPYSMVRSFEGYHMDQVLFLPDHGFSARELGELVWTISHQNILEFLSGVPEERQYRMSYEELATRPAEVMSQMCDRLAIPFHPGLLEPYKDTERKMTDGIYADSTPMGDTKFLAYRGINPKAAEAWKQVAKDNFLGDVTWEVARSLGYEVPPRDEEKSDAGQSPDVARRGLIRQRELRRAHRAAVEESAGDA